MAIADAKPLQQSEISKPQQDDALKARIMAHNFDKPWVKLPFSKRLARENGWPYAFAQRVIGEYRRFVYLACIAGDEVTPSDEVDQAWHLHLAYSRDYWERFCPDVLGRPLHHGPTNGGDIDDARFAANYRRTLALYAEVFGQDPPPDIWPPAQLRFGYAASQVRINRALFSIAPKSTLKPPQPPRPFMGRGIAVYLACVAVIFAIRAYVLDVSGFNNLVVLSFAFAIPAAMVFTLLLEWAEKRRARARVSKDLSHIAQPQHGYTVTYTVGGGAAVVAVSIDGDGSGDGGDGDGDGGDGGGCGGGCGG